MAKYIKHASIILFLVVAGYWIVGLIEADEPVKESNQIYVSDYSCSLCRKEFIGYDNYKSHYCSKKYEKEWIESCKTWEGYDKVMERWVAERKKREQQAKEAEFKWKARLIAEAIRQPKEPNQACSKELSIDVYVNDIENIWVLGKDGKLYFAGHRKDWEQWQALSESEKKRIKENCRNQACSSGKIDQCDWKEGCIAHPKPDPNEWYRTHKCYNKANKLFSVSDKRISEQDIDAARKDILNCTHRPAKEPFLVND